MGFIAYIAYNAIYIAGEIIDMQVGFGIVNVMDPMSNIQVPVTANVYFIISMLIFLLINGHQMLIKTLFDSFTSLPLGMAQFNAEMTENCVSLFSSVFATGFRIAAPIVATILIADIVLGTISKMVPQMNIFVVGMPLKIMVGVLVLVITIPMFVTVMESVFKLMNGSVVNYVKELHP
jgi:flagellar biosynthetic protein FliR